MEFLKFLIPAVLVIIVIYIVLQDKVRSQLRVSGLPFSLYWLSSFIVEFLKFLIPAVLVIIVIYIVLQDKVRSQLRTKFIAS